MTDTINVNLHGHCLAGFDEWWKRQCGVEGKNLAGVVTDKCIEKGLGIYTITNDPFGDFTTKSRFDHMFGYAKDLSKADKGYQLVGLGDHAFVVDNNGSQVYFLDGQSLRIHGDKSFELLTFGRSGVQDFSSLDEAFTYLEGEGLPAIAEHPLSEGHYGSMQKQLLEELCHEGKLTAVEHNAKIALPWIFNHVLMFKGYTKKRNKQAVEIARGFEIPVVANDDADEISQIGAAYTSFPKDRIRTTSGKQITNDLIGAINDNDFETHEGYVSTFNWMRYAIWHIKIKDHILKRKI